MIEGALGKVIYTKKATDLQKEGYLSKSKILFVNSHTPSGFNVSNYNIMYPSEKYDMAIVNNDHRNDLIKKIANSLIDRRTLFVVRLIEHGTVLAKLLDCSFVHGSVPNKNRIEIRRQFEDGEIKRLVSTNIYDESVNIPALEVIVCCGGHSADNAQVQRHGRVIRKKDLSALHIDFYDWWAADVKRHSEKRIKILQKEGHEVVKVGLFNDLVKEIKDLGLINE